MVNARRWASAPRLRLSEFLFSRRLLRSRVSRMVTQSRSRALARGAACSSNDGRRRALVIFSGLCCLPMLAGCTLDIERPDLGLEIPSFYRAARGAPDSARPALDWWRGFRSKELTALIEEAQTANFDIAVAAARIMQADAQSRISGAALLPTVDLT